MLERGEYRIDHADRFRRLRFRQADPEQAVDGNGFEVVLNHAGLQRIDPGVDGAFRLVLFDELPRQCARLGLLGNRDRILEVEHQRIGAVRRRLRQHVGPVGGHDE